MTSQTIRKRLFVSGLPYNFTEGQLLRLFVGYGRVLDARIIISRWGKSRGMGYVEFENEEEAIKAKTEMHNKKIGEDRSIIVDYAKPDPLDTPEGKKRYQEAVARKPKRKERRDFTDAYGHIRDSVFKQRKFGAKVGKKLAKKTKKRNQ